MNRRSNPDVDFIPLLGHFTNLLYLFICIREFSGFDVLPPQVHVQLSPPNIRLFLQTLKLQSTILLLRALRNLESLTGGNPNHILLGWKTNRMASILAIVNSRPAKIIIGVLAFFTVLLLANWRVVWGWYYYYSEFYGGSDIGGKCVYILREPNFWKRVQNNRDWWFRMRCEGNLTANLSQGNSWLDVQLNPLVSYS